MTVEHPQSTPSSPSSSSGQQNGSHTDADRPKGASQPQQYKSSNDLVDLEDHPIDESLNMKVGIEDSSSHTHDK